MLLEVIDENGTKKFRQLSGTTSDGIPLGSYVSVEGNAVPDGFLECDGSTFDADAYPALAMLLGSNTLPTVTDPYDSNKKALIKAVPGHVEDTTGLFNQIKNYSVSKTDFKAIVAASSDFADFQSRVAAM